MNDLFGDDSLRTLLSRPFAPPRAFTAPVLTVTVNDHALLTIARQLHDGACLHGNGCGLQDFHAMDVYETDVRIMLAAMVQASHQPDNAGNQPLPPGK